MRMWMVPPRHMCRKHLLGEHVELHMFVGSIKNGVRVEGYLANNLGDHDQIRDASNPGVAKSIGRRVKLRPHWDEMKYQIMWDILQAKFLQNPAALRVLLATGKRMIVEGNTWADDIWGMIQPARGGTLWYGKNVLGTMLMEIRDSYQDRDAG